MTDLTTNYLGLKLNNPLVASASPLSEKVETAQKLEEAGVSALVVYSLFEEQVRNRTQADLHTEEYNKNSFAEALSYFPNHGVYISEPEKYLKQIGNLKDNLSIPVIGSLNGTGPGEWTEYAKMIEDMGADAIELNTYFLNNNPDVSAADIEQKYLELVAEIKKGIDIPLAVKLSPFFSSLPNFAKMLKDAGADGLVLFNRFYQPDFDLEELEVSPNLHLSTSEELRLPLRWIAILKDKVDIDLALTSGVHTAEDMVKGLLAGANAVMSASALLKHGPMYAKVLLDDFEAWMVEKEYDSVAQMQGSMAQGKVADPDAFERANYMKELLSYSNLP